MHVIRLILRLVVLVMILVLGACGSSAPKKAELPTGQTNAGISTPTTDIFASLPRRKMTEKPVPLLIPVRLVIPAIEINASVESVGIRSDSDLATPAHHPWEDVGWYDLGPLPSERGSAVIDGHLDRPGGSPAVFWRLRDIQVGDDVQVMNDAGKTLHFRVTGVAYYIPDQAPLQEIFGNLGGIYLNLSTCAGDWIPGQHQTGLRLVIYTTLVWSPGLIRDGFLTSPCGMGRTAHYDSGAYGRAGESRLARSFHAQSCRIDGTALPALPGHWESRHPATQIVTASCRR